MKNKPEIVVKQKQPYHCFDHDIRYGLDDLMCPKCEDEICASHDDTLCSCGLRQKMKCVKENGLGTGKMCARV